MTVLYCNIVIRQVVNAYMVCVVCDWDTVLRSCPGRAVFGFVDGLQHFKHIVGDPHVLSTIWSGVIEPALPNETDGIFNEEADNDNEGAYDHGQHQSEEVEVPICITADYLVLT